MLRSGPEIQDIVFFFEELTVSFGDEMMEKPQGFQYIGTK